MAWTALATNHENGVGGWTETKTLPSSATTEYSTVLPYSIGPDYRTLNKYVAFSFNASAVSGTNLDIALYGSDTPTGTKTLLKDAVVADITATGKNTGIVDLNAYPSLYYFLAWTADANESANTITVTVITTPPVS